MYCAFILKHGHVNYSKKKQCIQPQTVSRWSSWPMACTRLHNAPQDGRDKWGNLIMAPISMHQLAGINTYAVAQPLVQLLDYPYGAGSKSYFTHSPFFFAWLYLPLPAPLQPPPPPPHNPSYNLDLCSQYMWQNILETPPPVQVTQGNTHQCM